MKLHLAILVGVSTVLADPVLSQSDILAGAIAPSPTHMGYWRYQGENVLLLGGSIEDNLFQIPGLEAHLDLLTANGGNYVRCTMSSRDSGDVWPFRLDPETGLYDLNQWNDEYWTRFSNLLYWAERRGIIVQIEVWATFDYYRDPWNDNPFNPKNNVNYTAERVKIPESIPSHPTWQENPFFWSIPNQRNNLPVLTFQQKYVDKLLAISLKHGNVLYCMDNETSVTAEWGRFWAKYIQKKAREESRIAYCTEMWDPWDLDHITHRETFDHPEIYAFVEISQNNHQRGQAHWNNGLRQIERLRRDGLLRPVNNVKIYGADGGQHGGDTDEAIAKFVRNVFFGAASARFHRPPSGIGLSPRAQMVIRSMRRLSDRMDDFFNGQPRNDLLPEREDNSAYCRAIVGREYAVYFPNGGATNLDLRGASGSADLQWLSVSEGEWRASRRVEASGILRLDCPGPGHWVALLKISE
jgi:hypothetical protein